MLESLSTVINPRLSAWAGRARIPCSPVTDHLVGDVLRDRQPACDYLQVGTAFQRERHVRDSYEGLDGEMFRQRLRIGFLSEPHPEVPGDVDVGLAKRVLETVMTHGQRAGGRDAVRVWLRALYHHAMQAELRERRDALYLPRLLGRQARKELADQLVHRPAPLARGLMSAWCR